MPLSRLDNFPKNARGNILYVNPNDLDADRFYRKPDNSPWPCPFKTIQRALIEAARFSYQTGLDNDNLVRQPFFFILENTLLTPPRMDP